MLDLMFRINFSTRGFIWGPSFSRYSRSMEFELGLGPILLTITGTVIRSA